MRTALGMSGKVLRQALFAACCLLGFGWSAAGQDQPQDEFSEQEFSDQGFTDQEFADDQFSDGGDAEFQQAQGQAVGGEQASGTKQVQAGSAPAQGQIQGQTQALPIADEEEMFLDESDPGLYGQDSLEPAGPGNVSPREDEFVDSQLGAPPEAEALSQQYTNPAIDTATLNQTAAPEALSQGGGAAPQPAPLEQGQELAAPQSAAAPGEAVSATPAGGPIDSMQNADGSPPPSAYQPIPAPNEFAGTPPLPGTMRQLAEGEAPDEYYIEPGDTLYDIGDQLLDEPTYWPKLWALNPQIKNPHFIYPGMAIRFYPGDEEDPPFLQVVIEEELPVEPEFAFMQLSEIFKERPFEPQTMEVIDASQLEIPFNINDMFIDSGELYRSSARTVRVPAFVYAAAKEPVAVVIHGTQGEKSSSPKASVVAEALRTVEPGTLYTILRPATESMTEFDGHLYYFVANIKFTEKVGDAGTHFVGKVSDPGLGTSPGDLVVEFISTVRGFELSPAYSSSDVDDGKVIAFESDGKNLGRAGDFAMLNAGSGKVQVGQFVNVYTERAYWDDELRHGILENSRIPAAVLRIIDATDAGSTAMIVKSTREIHAGDVLKL